MRPGGCHAAGGTGSGAPEGLALGGSECQERRAPRLRFCRHGCFWEGSGQPLPPPDLCNGKGTYPPPADTGAGSRGPRQASPQGRAGPAEPFALPLSAPPCPRQPRRVTVPTASPHGPLEGRGGRTKVCSPSASRLPGARARRHLRPERFSSHRCPDCPREDNGTRSRGDPTPGGGLSRMLRAEPGRAGPGLACSGTKGGPRRARRQLRQRRRQLPRRRGLGSSRGIRAWGGSPALSLAGGGAGVSS